jgi:ParB-like chromosome segregation protein Spo0J
MAKPSGAASAIAPAFSKVESHSPDERRAGNLGKIVYRDPAALVPYERNSRKHSERQVKQLRAAMDEFGFTNPILLRDDRRIGAGHGRQLAALLDPPLARVPTITVHGLNDQQWRALIISDNKLALNAEWDSAMLAAELHALGADDFDVAVIGFSEAEIADLTALDSPSDGGGTADPDSVVCPSCQHRFVPE